MVNIDSLIDSEHCNEDLLRLVFLFDMECKEMQKFYITRIKQSIDEYSSQFRALNKNFTCSQSSSFSTTYLIFQDDFLLQHKKRVQELIANYNQQMNDLSNYLNREISNINTRARNIESDLSNSSTLEVEARPRLKRKRTLVADRLEQQNDQSNAKTSDTKSKKKRTN